MKKILVVGFGTHVKKNILPAIGRLNGLEIESIIVRDLLKYESEISEYGLKLKHIDDIIRNDVDWVYIATPISTHYDLVKKYLNAGKSVICEKPLTNNLMQTKSLFELARKKEVQLFEVCMYQYHKQFKHLKTTIDKNFNDIRSVSSKFSIPHISKNDIRYKKKMGGGALLDVGYYPISLFVSLFGKPRRIKSTNYSEMGFEVDLFGSAIFEYEQFYCIAEWGIGLPYANEATVITEKQNIKYERIFSKPETFSTVAEVSEGFETYQIEIGSDDQFLNMFNNIILKDSQGGYDTSLVYMISQVLDNLS